MISLTQAKELSTGNYLYTLHSSPARVIRWKVTSVKTWKRDSNRVEIGLRHGLYTHDKISESHLGHMFISEQDAEEAKG